MNMIERIARALVRSNHPDASDADIDAMWEGWSDDAATAIKEMRDPTPEMVWAGQPFAGYDEAEDAYRAMIDAAMIDASPIATYEMEPIDTSFGVGEG